MSGLRERIAEAIRGADSIGAEFDYAPMETYLEYADAIVEALGLKPQFSSGSSIYNRRLNSVHVRQIRWVTDWVDDADEPDCDCGDCCR